jgi:hypothetical protein
MGWVLYTAPGFRNRIQRTFKQNAEDVSDIKQLNSIFYCICLCVYALQEGEYDTDEDYEEQEEGGSEDGKKKK